MEFMSVTAAVFQPLRGGLKAPALKNLASERATRGASVSVSVTTPEYPGSTSGGEQEESQAADRDTRRACSYDWWSYRAIRPRVSSYLNDQLPRSP